MVKALTLHQPWASLVAVGAKTIETRSWSTSYRGPLAIHAGAKRFGFSSPAAEVVRALPLETWRLLGYRGEREDRHGDLYEYRVDPELCDNYPLGAVVASCRLVDVVRIVDRLCGTDMSAPPHLCRSDGVLLIHRPEGDPFDNGDTERDVSDQAPFGDFTPGGFAWLLEDVKPTTERCPACWGEGWAADDGCDPKLSLVQCSTCHAAKVCEPVPAKGRQGLWTWAP